MGAAEFQLREMERRGVVATSLRQCLIVTACDDLGGRGMDELKTVTMEALDRRPARSVIMDLSPVRLMDADEFEQLTLMVKAIALLGTQVVLVGLGAGLIMHLVDAGADTRGIRAVSTLEHALELFDATA